jgi:hypothetical protein
MELRAHAPDLDFEQIKMLTCPKIEYPNSTRRAGTDRSGRITGHAEVIHRDL